LRLTQVKLAGFKSFVDPTAIGTPGQLVGIVGPNGCGKSNVIDAVRWVLGESKASALRGESMQDVIFNGAGERKPVGRASVELIFDNSAGRIGGQWGQYAELSIKRVLTRDGDSTYYINNIPVRRRDIHDLFLGTGLGPRAYAIIEQGMISRVIEAKPEELRIFLEEAAGVSKYKERRKETEGRLSDTRENLARVEDIRLELGNQLTRLEQQAKVASEFRDYEARLKQAQHLAWYSKQQDAVRMRERHAGEIGTLTVALESIQAELRGAEAKLEGLRTEHYAAGDALHDKQGAYYAANSEVTRLEQQLAFARESETRLTQQVAQLTEQIGALGGQDAGLTAEGDALAAALEEALAARERAADEERAAHAALPPLETAVADATAVMNEIQQQIAEAEQNARIAETRRDNLVQALAQLAQRRARLEAELAQIAAPVTDPIREVDEQLTAERRELSDRESGLATLQAAVQALQAQQRDASEQWQRDSTRLADLDARRQALAELQAKIGHGADVDGWLAARGLERARQLWQALDIERGWEDALEAVLRERLKALEIGRLDDAQQWIGDGGALPARLAAYARDAVRHAPAAGGDALLGKVRFKEPEVARFVADGLAGIRCRDTLVAALADRAALALGESYVTPEGHLVSAQGVLFFAPDSELHGVIVRQRELAELGIGAAGRAGCGGGVARRARGARKQPQVAAAGISRRKPGARLAATARARSRARARPVEAGRRGRGGAPLAADRRARRCRGAGGRAVGAAGRRGARDRRPAVAVARRRRAARRRTPRAERARKSSWRAAASGCARRSGRRRNPDLPSAVSAIASAIWSGVGKRWLRTSRSSARCLRS
jgi:chromosome segregation protein